MASMAKDDSGFPSLRALTQVHHLFRIYELHSRRHVTQMVQARLFSQATYWLSVDQYKHQFTLACDFAI